MYDEAMENQQDQYVSAFEIMVDQNCMVSSYVIQKQSIKFPNVDLVVDQHGINKLSDPNTKFNTIKIEPKSIKELQILGKGSAGIVRRAVYKLNDKQYVFAVKSINATLPEHRKQLLNDLRSYLLGGYSEYLIQFYTCFFHDGLVKQVIEYMDMGSLRILIQLIAAKKITLSEPEMATIVFKILKGLHYIHETRQLIHRDIKPENILLNSKGEVKITDFGVSKCVENSTGKSIVGTVTYMSPQRVSLSETYTFKCDIWSLGLILFELATGSKIPYSELGGKFNYFKACQKIATDQPPQLPPKMFSGQMYDFFKRCLQKKAQDRASAQVLLNHGWILSNLGKANLRSLVQRMQTI